MKVAKQPTKQRDLRPSSIDKSESTVKWGSAKAILRLALPAVIAAAVLFAPIEFSVLAQTGHQADSKESSPIDPAAMDALNKMGTYLRTLKAFQVRADVATDDVLNDGQTIQFSSKVDIVAARPNRLRIEVTDDAGHRFFFFNGKDFTIFGISSTFGAPFGGRREECRLRIPLTRRSQDYLQG